MPETTGSTETAGSTETTGSTGSSETTVTATGDDLRARVDRVRAVHAGGRTRSLRWRLEALEGLGRLLREQEDAIAAALAADLGRDPVEAFLGDVASTLAEVDHARTRLRRWMRRRPVALPLNQLPALAWVQHEPLGTVLVIGPWNFPVYLSLGPMVAALAAGNAVVLKPSELAPATSALLARLLPRYVDPEAVLVVEGGAGTSQELLALGFDHAVFTGGTEIGRKVMAAAAPTLTPVTLELGGKSPVVVAADADLRVAARRVAWVKLQNSGQMCIAPDYVLVDRTVRDAFVAELEQVMASFRADREGGLRIVNRRQFDRLRQHLERTRGRLVGGVVDEAAMTITPAIVVDPPADDSVMSEELFGPVLPVLAYDRLDEAVALITARPKPLALYGFTRRRDVREALLAIPAGGTVFNHVAMHVLVPALPFGGVGESGMGAYHGRWGFEALSHRKSVLVKTTRPDPSFVYPPYSDRAVALLRRLF